MRIRKIINLMVIASTVLIISGCTKASKAYKTGMELAENGKYEKSLLYFKQAMKEDNQNINSYIGYGMSLNRLCKYEDAKQIFDKALFIGKKISKEEKKQIYYGTAISEYGLADYNEVVKECDKALDIEYLDDMNQDILYTKAVALELSGNQDESQKILKKIIADNDKYTDAYMELAKLQQISGEGTKAEKTYLNLIKLDQKYYDARFALYEQYRMDSKDDLADEVLNKIISLKSNNAKNMLAIGRAYYYKGDFARAKEMLEMAQKANNKDSSYYLGIILMKQNLYDDAIKEFNHYIKAAKESEMNADVYNQLANSYMSLGKYSIAENMVTKGMSFGSSATMQNLRKTQIILWEQQKKYKEALAAAKEYQKNYPQDKDIAKEIVFINAKQ